MTKRMLGEVVHDLISSRTDKILRVTHLRELEWFEPRRYFDEDEFEFLLRSRAGGIYHSHLELSEDSSTASFIFISPNDDWLYICFITHLTRSYSTLVFASDERVDVGGSGPAMVLQYLAQHVIQVSDELDKLASIVEDVERIVQEVADDTLLAELIKQLHLCNTWHVMLQRRWTFQRQLMCTVDNVISSGTHIGLLWITDPREESMMMKMRQ
jgi:hypothetical protein